MPDSDPGPISIVHSYQGDRLRQSEARFPPGQRVEARVFSCRRNENGLLTSIDIVDRPSGRTTTMVLEWEEGSAALDAEEQFLRDMHQQ